MDEDTGNGFIYFIGNMDKFKNWIGYILFAVAVIGWAYDSGVKSQKIEVLKLEISVLKEDNNDIKEFINEQIKINTKLGTIVDFVITAK